MNPIREIIEALLKLEKPTKEDLQRLKLKVAEKYRIAIPSNSEIIKECSPEEFERLKEVLIRKRTRTISGIAVVAVMTKPFPCPHGKCIYCPGGPDKMVPQSYTGMEPASMRAIQAFYHPYYQVLNRIKQLEAIGHRTSKLEIIVMGGTFTAMPLCYQEWFVKEIYGALCGKHFLTLEEAKRCAEKAKHRAVGLTIETRPDWAKEEQINVMLKLGATRVELGVQTIYNFIYARVKRGHYVRDVVESTKLLKDSAYKLVYHLMPGLPGSNPSRDLRVFKRVFDDQRFRPDMLKLYPTLVLEGTKLYEMWLSGEYEPYDDEKAIEVIARMLKHLPRYVRVMRIQRDVPSTLVKAGVKRSNLRQLVYRYMEEKGWKINDIRYREVGHAMLRGKTPSLENVELLELKYKASDGIEYFLSFEDTSEDILIGFLRLRIPDEPFRQECKDAALVRELHVYGPQLPVGLRPRREWQHRGFGRLLLKRAEEIAKEEGFKRIIVISGVGAREYYRKLGYRLVGEYMGKVLCTRDH